MQTFDIIKKTEVPNSFRSKRVKSDFDIQKDKVEFNTSGKINININGDWSIGAIIGNSGTGKTLIAKELFKEHKFIDKSGFDWGDKPIIEEMPEDKTVKEITKIFTAVGFSSPPSWLKPYSVLSQGEKMRADFARALLFNSKILAFDEFTSVVDRDVAKTMSMAMRKSLNKANIDKKIVVVTCHKDILEWLQPDWYFNTNIMETKKKLDGKDQNWSLKLEGVLKTSGKSLGNITI